MSRKGEGIALVLCLMGAIELSVSWAGPGLGLLGWADLLGGSQQDSPPTPPDAMTGATALSVWSRTWRERPRRGAGGEQATPQSHARSALKLPWSSAFF